MNELINSYKNHLKFEKRYADHTIKAYLADIHSFQLYLKDQYEIKQLADAQHGHVRAFIVHLIQNEYQSKSVNRKISSIRGFYLFLLKQGHIQMNPVGKIKALKLPKRLPQFISEDQAVDLLNYIGEVKGDYRNHLDSIIIYLLYQCGLRRQECIDLKIKDIGDEAIKVKGKGSKERFVPISKSLRDKLSSFMELKMEMEIREGEYLLTLENGNKLYPKYVYNLINKYLQHVSSLSKRSPHVLRHSFATHLSNSGADLNAIKELLGHSSLAATQIYTHTSMDKLMEVYKKAHPKANK